MNYLIIIAFEARETHENTKLLIWNQTCVKGKYFFSFLDVLLTFTLILQEVYILDICYIRSSDAILTTIQNLGSVRE